MLRRSALLLVLLGLFGASGIAQVPEAQAAVVRSIVFPVREKSQVDYVDTFGACRDGCSRRHEGQDLIGPRMLHLVAARDATITFMRTDAAGTAGNWIELTDADGWSYRYMHVNNDRPGTDDGSNFYRYAFARGMREDVRVSAGQFIAYMGDSGNAEDSTPHVHFEIRRPDGTAINAYESLRRAEGSTAPPSNQCGPDTTPAPVPRAGTLGGFFAVDATGKVAAAGNAEHLGDRSRRGVTSPIVGIATTPTGAGYWIAARDGAVYRFGDAALRADARPLHLGAGVVAIAAHPDGGGVWLVSADGVVAAFGSARQFGAPATSGVLRSRVVGISATASGNGYWVVTDRGTVYAYGDARHRGDATRLSLVSPITRLIRTPSGSGYWLMSRRGGLLAYGDAIDAGSVPELGRCDQPAAAGLLASRTGLGYAIAQTSGAVIGFGDAFVPGQVSGLGSVVDVTATP